MHGIIDKSEGVNDLREQVGDERFLNVGREAVRADARAYPRWDLVVDVGSGFLDAPRIGRWIDNHGSVALIADVEVAYERWKKRLPRPPSLDDYRAREFSETRQKLYERASVRLDVSDLDIETTVRQLHKALCALAA